jgi:transcriptional regulator GlxA family with amidase domain
MREKTSKGPVKSIWSSPSNNNEPIWRWASGEIMIKRPRVIAMDKASLQWQAMAEMPDNPRFLPSSPRVVEILAYPAVQLLDVAGPLQVFASANELTARNGEPPLYAARVVSAGAPVVTASAGLGLLAAPLPPARAALDTLLVAGGPGVHAAAADSVVLQWLCSRAKRARRIASVCTGAFLLAAAGLLNGRRAATHWMHCAELARRYPAVQVEPDPIFVRDGTVWTSAGVTAAIDLALALVDEDVGRSLALAVARQLVCSSSVRAGRRSSALHCRFRAPRTASAHCTVGWSTVWPTTCRSLPWLGKSG